MEAAATSQPTPPAERVSSFAKSLFLGEINETFCTRATDRVMGVLDQVGRNDDERMVEIAKLAYQRGQYGYAFFED